MNLKQLVDEGGSLDSQIKDLTNKFKDVKEKILALSVSEDLKTKALESLKLGEKVNPVKNDGDKFKDTISFTSVYSDIDPVDLFKYMDKKGLSDRYFDVVKVQATPLGKIIGSEQMEKMREVKSVTLKIGFKAK